MGVRYYGSVVDEGWYVGRAGRLVLALNRAREVVERATEVAAAVHDAIRSDTPVTQTLLKLREEGLTRPAPARTRAPVHVLDQFRQKEPDDPTVDSRFYKTRDYSARVGRRLDHERADRANGVVADPSLTLYNPRAFRRSSRAQRYASEPLLRECFAPTGDQT